jgi:hypothetical protein
MTYRPVAPDPLTPQRVRKDLVGARSAVMWDTMGLSRHRQAALRRLAAKSSATRSAM